MNKDGLILRLQDIEWEDFEVKESRNEVPKNAWETVSAFANTAGGWLIFGVKKSGRSFDIIGVQSPDKIEQDFLTTLRGDKFNKKLQAKAKKYNIDGKIVLGFYIPSLDGKSKPLYFNSVKNTFIRTGSGDQRATQEEIDALYRNASFDKKDEELTGFMVKDLDTQTIKRYRTYLDNIDPEHRYNRLSTEELLERLHAVRKGKVTVGGLLVFGNEETISSIIGDFRIDYLEIMGTSYGDAPTKYHYRLSEEDNLFGFYFSIFERLKKKIDVPFKQEGEWLMGVEDQPQVRAVKEALVNLLMHADYFSNTKPRIRVFLDRIEFFNPGSLPKDIKFIIKEEFSMPRNPTVARIFRHIRLSENIGSGFDKMFKGWTAYYKKKPLVTGDFDYYKIVFPLDTKNAVEGGKARDQGLVEGLAEKLVEGLAENQKKIWEEMKVRPSISKRELAKKIGISTTAVDKNIVSLKLKGLLKRVGPDKGGHWEAVEK